MTRSTAALTARDLLPSDAATATLVGRVFDARRGAPLPVLVRGERVWDASGITATVADLFDLPDHLERLEVIARTEPSWSIDEFALPVGAAADARTGATAPLTLLAPIDLQAIKACGVTFAGSMVERVIEERAGGDAARAAEVRAEMTRMVGSSIDGIVPGSPAAERLKAELIARGWWSQYLEVGLGPDPEVFTKAPVMSAVGSGDEIGVPSFSAWNNPEPELVLVVDPRGRIIGVTLGNDVNLRDVEGRSALLLGMAKDNNRSCALGPFVRLFDDGFALDDARGLDIELAVAGEDGYRLAGVNSVGALSRSFEELVGATIGRHHQYPDGLVLFTGTLFAPTEDRDAPGQGFTHKHGDVVTISNSRLGALVDVVGETESLAPWTYGIRQLYADLRAAALGAAGGPHR